MGIDKTKEMFKILVLLWLVVSMSAHDEADRNVQWDYDDPRWDSKIPNWWEPENFVPPEGPVDEKSHEFWMNHGQNLLKNKVHHKLNTNRAKNLVIFIGDGMGLTTQMAARSYKGDVSRQLSFEKFHFAGLSKTYCVNYQVPDSACTATAIFGGVKNNFEVISLTGDVSLRDCKAQQDENNHIDSIFKYAQDAGKATGIITNTRITHATPAATFAKTASRNWESNEGVPDGCHDIAYQLVHGEIGSKLDVIFGGGRRSFFPNTFVNENNERGWRTDNLNLIDDFKEVQKRLNKKAVFIQTREQLMKINVTEIDKVLGLFAHSHLQYKLLSPDSMQPTLKEMTAKAIQILRKNKNGFVLMVEGGRIDNAHHETRARLALEETLEFDKTVELVQKQTNEDDTLLIVTADHSHVFTAGGYPPRGRNILGVGDFSRHDSMWFFTLGYANGPGHFDHVNQQTGARQNPRGMQYMNPLFRQPATVPKEEETHSGEDVGVYANGPFAHIFSGVYEQSYIMHAMAYATCLGPEEFMKNPQCTASAAIKSVTTWTLILTLIPNFLI